MRWRRVDTLLPVTARSHGFESQNNFSFTLNTIDKMIKLARLIVVSVAAMEAVDRFTQRVLNRRENSDQFSTAAQSRRRRRRRRTLQES